MARPKSDGLLYFPFDTDFFYSDKRIRALRARFGCDGLVIYIYLLTEIYRNGYFIFWDEISEEDMMAELNLKDGLIKQVVAYLVNRSLLQSILVDSITALTSPGIQKRYQEAVKGLKRDVFVRKELWLLEESKTAAFIKFTKKYDKSEKNESKSEKNESKSEKNQINERKGKETKRNEIKEVKTTRSAFNVEQAWNDTFSIYPKKSEASVAKQRWMDRILFTIQENRKEVAVLIYNATKAYLEDYEKQNPDDEIFKFVPKYGNWLVNDCDYWMSKVQEVSHG